MNDTFTLIRRSFVAAATALAFVGLVGAPAHALVDESPSAVNVDAQGVAVAGYDPVAYFAEAKAVPGSTEITAEHEGATYRFASAANRDAFVADPAKYLPVYGGFCALGTAYGYKVDIDPQAWRIEDGKLYLNNSPDVQKTWLEDVPGYIAKADANWPGIKDKAPKDIE